MNSVQEEIRKSILEKYARVAVSVEGCFKYPTGKEGAIVLGYDRDTLDRLPDEIFSSFCGVGNPFSLGPISTDNIVLDIGCGAGVDLIIASYLVGEAGKVYGIDLTPEMVKKARKNMELSKISNAEAQVANSEKIPFGDGTFDVVISNGVLNLSPDKNKTFREIYRILKPGGRLQFADIVLQENLPQEIVGSIEAWSD